MDQLHHGLGAAVLCPHADHPTILHGKAGLNLLMCACHRTRTMHGDLYPRELARLSGGSVLVTVPA